MMLKTQQSGSPVTVQEVRAFVSGGEGGNPAGVVLDADRLSPQEMQAVAAAAGMSETAFVSRSTSAGFKLDFFTPNRRIAHCGHATVAAFSLLAELGQVGEGETSKETIDGNRKIVIREGAAYMEQLAPTYGDSDSWRAAGVTRTQVWASLGLTVADLDSRIEPVVVNTGNSFMMLAVRDGPALRAIKPDFDAIAAISERLDLIGYYVFTTDPSATEKDATARMFAPRYAIEEEAATGMAAGPLACLLYDRLGLKKSTLVIEQGCYMDTPSPSVIRVELELSGGVIKRLMAGGGARVIEQLEVHI